MAGGEGWTHSDTRKAGGLPGVHQPASGQERAAVEVFAFCLMTNHWHLLLRPQGDGNLAA
jgi:hypothetical protein